MRSTIILCCVAVIGIVAAVTVERASSHGADDGAGGRLFAFGEIPVNDMTRIVLHRGADPPMTFARTGGAWRQVTPFEHPVDPHSIQQIAALAATLEIAPNGVSGNEVPLSALGLDPPRGRVEMIWDGGSVTLLLGHRGIAGRAYLMVEGDESIHVVNYELHDRALDMDPREWRERRIFDNIGVDSDRVEIVTADQRTVLARDRKKWMLETPVRSRVNDLALDELFQALGRARSAGFLLDEPGDLSPFGLESPVASITVTTTRRTIRDDGTVDQRLDAQRLRIGSRVGVGSQDRFGLIEGRAVVVRIPEAVLQALFLTPKALVSNVPSGVVPADVMSIIIRSESGAWELRRELERWVAPDYDNKEVDGDLVDELLAGLARNPAPEVEIRPYPRDLQVATITLRGYGGKPLDTVRIAHETQAEGSRWALENGDDVLRIYPPSMQLRLHPVDFGLK